MALAWYFSGSTDTGASLAALGQTPGVAPPDYAYLDNAQVALYLGQIEGGAAQSERLTQEVARNGTAGVSAGGVSLGGSVGSTATAERVVTPTATARFYQLLDQLGQDGYLHTINMAEAPAQIVRDFAVVPEGSFVQLRNCTVQLPSYVQLLQAARSPGFDFGDPLGLSGSPTNPATAPIYALEGAEVLAGRGRGMLGTAADTYPRGEVKRIDGAIHGLVRTVGPNPRVPMASCDGNADEFKPRGVDLLFPILLANFSSEESLTAGPVTVVGKLVRAVRNGADYVDDESLTTFSKPLSQLKAARVPGPDGHSFVAELYADSVVLAPGAVILPIAIYN